MKKSNRIEEKGDTARGAAQSKKTRQARASRHRRTPAAPVVSTCKPPEITPWAFPCHRLAPRSLAELHALRKFTANLGIYLATCVFAGGYAQHLFRIDSGDYLLVTEGVICRGPDGLKHDISEVLWHYRETLAEFLKRRRRVRLERKFSFEAMPLEEVARWIEETGTTRRVNAGDRERIFGMEEAEGATKGKLIHAWGGKDPRRIYACAGEYKMEFATTGEVRELSRADVCQELNFELLHHLIAQAVPASFSGEFYVRCKDADQLPAEPGDVLK